MKIFHSSLQASKKIKRPVVALGNFDGVHLAHQKMILLTKELARKLKGSSCVYSFEPHPVKVLSPDSAPSLISTITQKLKLLAKLKIAATILEPFNIQFAQLSPEDFVEKILIRRLGVVGIVVGYDFTFGAKRSGNPALLKKICLEKGIECQVMDVFLLGQTLVSSTQIRQLIREGNVEKASFLLGRKFDLRGTIVRGEGIGKKLGFPTANLSAENELIPAHGVYATRVKIGLRWYEGVTNVGVRPTFGHNKLAIETHLFKFNKNIYGKKIRLQFIKKIRDEKVFANPQALRDQIEQDSKIAQKILKGETA